ncbi:MAG: STAS domain-containing protein [SAR324 cluster bacterium]|nr:STAS domain-containing protein [SAR324 cluster bacterium]
MELSHRLEKDICIIDILGKLTDDQSSKFNAYVTRLLDEIKPNILLLNVENLDIIDSPGLGSIIRLNNKALEKQIEFAVCESSKRIQFILESAHMDKLIKTYKTEKRALKYLGMPKQ